jgi:hypothetical protein
MVWYVENRRKKRSITLNSKALLTIEAEPDVSWQVLNMDELVVVREGIGKAEFPVPVTLTYNATSFLFSLLPDKYFARFKQSRFCAYKLTMWYQYGVMAETESDSLVFQLCLGEYFDKSKSVDGLANVCLFIRDAVHVSRHWIWPDWFEIFNRQAKQE